MRRFAALPLAVLLMAGGALVGCGSSSDDDDSAATTTPEAAGTTADDVTTTTAAAEDDADTGEGAAQVDLEITGTYVLQIHGERGACKGLAGRFAFEMTDDDVPGIGESFSVPATGASASISWVIDDNNSYAGSGEDGGAVASEDSTSVQIDDDLVVLEPQGSDRPVHVKGTITCPPPS